VSTLDDGTQYAITIPKTDFTINGEQTVGGESETIIPVMLKAIYNPRGTGTKNLYYENFWATSVSATADVPPAF
jgi:arabinogalactan endo-1,4-beta-galactosidase